MQRALPVVRRLVEGCAVAVAVDDVLMTGSRFVSVSVAGGGKSPISTSILQHIHTHTYSLYDTSIYIQSLLSKVYPCHDEKEVSVSSI